MELRTLVKLAAGAAAGAVALVGVANAAPLAPSAARQLTTPRAQAVQPAVVSQAEVDHLKPQEVRWGRHHGWHRGGWHRGWHRHHWRHRHWR